MPISTLKSPEYKEIRNVSVIDSVFDDIDLGLQTSHYQYTNVQVVPIDGANPTVEIMWWSEEAGSFIQEHTVIQKIGVGANTPFEFTVQSLNRVMFVSVTTLTAGSVKIFASGAILTHPE